jgi:hypothetical protein
MRSRFVIASALATLPILWGVACSTTEDSGTCLDSRTCKMQCDGYFLDNDGSICEACPKRGADGVWRYPGGRVENVDDSICFDAGPDADGAAGTGGTGGTGGAGGTGGTGGTGGEAGVDAEPDADAGDAEGGPGDSGDAEAEPYCDPTSLPGDDACVIADDYGIFVSPDGTDDASCGSSTAPCATITQGMARAKTESKRVYACGDNGDYAESVTVDAALNGLALFGGFRCSDWSYAPSTVRARVFPASEGVAWTVDGVNGLAVHDFAIESRDATTPGASSIAAVVRNASDVVFKNSTFTAGDGAKGDDGVDGAVGANGPEPTLAQRGVNATCTAPPAIHNGGAWELAQIICGSEGGMGGNITRGTATQTKSGDNGSDGELKTNLVPPVAGGGGTGSSDPAVAGGDGTAGANGLAGGNGVASAAAGAFTSAGFTPASGLPGTDGFPGQGGGGGGAGASAVSCTGASGGAGGMGGCGGKLGTSGKGGGSSVALLSWSSDVTLEECTLTSASGGNGGRGGNGCKGGNFSLGAYGGDGIATPSAMASGGDGGPGGLGGPGGSGSGGTGGPSYAVVVHGAEPTKVGTVALTPGSGGLKGTGGQAVGGVKAPDGSGGDAGATLIVP